MFIEFSQSLLFDGFLLETRVEIHSLDSTKDLNNVIITGYKTDHRAVLAFTDQCTDLGTPSEPFTLAICERPFKIKLIGRRQLRQRTILTANDFHHGLEGAKGVWE